MYPKNLKRPVPRADVGDDDVQSRDITEVASMRRAAQVDPASAALQHAPDEVTHVVGGEDIEVGSADVRRETKMLPGSMFN
jgi:hypothetical protein